MPILDVEIVGEVSDQVRRGLASRLAEAAGEALDSRPGGTWVKLWFLDDEAYAENTGGEPLDVKPILVSVLQGNRPEQEELITQAKRLTAAIAEECGRPAENVHVLFEPPAAGRIAFGGELRT